VAVLREDAPVPDPGFTLRTMEADWETVFTALQIAPLRLYYEDLVTNPAGLFEKIRQYLDVQWGVDPISIVSAYQCISDRHDPKWIQNLRAQFEALPVS
jgi:LPS sulfotransferase NodH